MRNPAPATTLHRAQAEAAAGLGASRPVELHVKRAGARVQVQTWATTGVDATALGTALGLPWPASTGAASGGRRRVLCIGPTRWLVVSDETPHVLLETLAAAVPGSTLTVVDMSQGLAALEVRGARSRELLSKACGLDLHASVFPVGACACTRLAHLPVVVDAGPGSADLTCYVSRSYLDYLYRWLTDAAAEFEDPIP